MTDKKFIKDSRPFLLNEALAFAELVHAIPASKQDAVITALIRRAPASIGHESSTPSQIAPEIHANLIDLVSLTNPDHKYELYQNLLHRAPHQHYPPESQTALGELMQKTEARCLATFLHKLTETKPTSTERHLKPELALPINTQTMQKFTSSEDVRSLNHEELGHFASLLISRAPHELSEYENNVARACEHDLSSEEALHSLHQNLAYAPINRGSHEDLVNFIKISGKDSETKESLFSGFKMLVERAPIHPETFKHLMQNIDSLNQYISLGHHFASPVEDAHKSIISTVAKHFSINSSEPFLGRASEVRAKFNANTPKKIIKELENIGRLQLVAAQSAQIDAQDDWRKNQAAQSPRGNIFEQTRRLAEEKHPEKSEEPVSMSCLPGMRRVSSLISLRSEDGNTQHSDQSSASVSPKVPVVAFFRRASAPFRSSPQLNKTPET